LLQSQRQRCEVNRQCGQLKVSIPILGGLITARIESNNSISCMWLNSACGNLSQYVFEPLQKGEEFILYRGWSKDDGSPVLVVSPVAEYPTPKILKWLEHAYSLREEIDPTWAARPIAIARHWDRPVLVLEDPGGTPLDQLLGQPLDLEPLLRLAISLAAAIGQLHQRGMVHKDIKPANFLVNSVTGQCWLRGFGFASRFPHERQSPEPPEFIAGTLAYMAPEQTGRVNGSIDSRSDLYSYGVMLYEMVTGLLPFTASDAMEWVHCHVARRPVPPDERIKGIPTAISAIVMRLLAKTAEERYQTAAGVESDLRRCLADWEKLGRIELISVGTEDAPDRLWIPERLYGRDGEVKVLLDAFERVVADGTSGLAVVSGYSGIGKSSVVNELQKAIVLPRRLFISGKFDQLRRDIPYATLAQAFQTLVRQILGKSEDEVDHWGKAIRQAVGPNGQLIANLIPELELIIGKQPSVPELPPQETQNRFQAALRRFLCVFAQKEHPLTLFLDDLQWLDVATLTFIEHLFTHSDIKHLLIVGAYRNNEVGRSHPLMVTLDSIRKAGVTVNEIVLNRLSFRDVNHFVADALRCERKHSEALARLIYKKTAGNPFFVIQFLTALAEEQLLEFDAGEKAWQWELPRIHTRRFTDNVVELMISKLRRLPVATQEVLKELACLGDSAKTATLAIVNGTREEEIHGVVSEAVHAGLVLRLPDSYKFLHDRVQEAAYSLIPPRWRAAVHLRIGRLLIERLTSKEIEESIFDVVNQLNRAAGLIADPEERLSLLRLNVIAGMKARAAIAYDSARNYLALAEALLRPDAWSQRYQETFDLYLAFSECEYLVGNFAAADKLFDLILTRAFSNLDRAKVYGLRMKLYQVAGKYDDGVTVALEALRLVGVTFPESDEEIQTAAAAELAEVPINLRGRPISELVDSPLAADPTVQAIINLLVEAVPCAYIGRPKLFPLITPKAVNFSLRYGHTEQSSFAYGVFAVMLVSAVGDLRTAFQYSEMSLRLNDKLKNPRLRGTLLHLHANHVNFWRRHISTGIPILEQAFLACLEVGDLVYAGFLAFETVWQLIEKGDTLEDVLALSQKYSAFAQECHNHAVYETIRLEQQFIASLQGKTKEPMSLDDGIFDEDACFASIAKATFGCGIVFYHIMKQILAFVHGHYTEALEAAAQAEPMLGAAMAMPIEATYHFCHALTLTALYPAASSAQRAEYRNILGDKLKKLRLWAENCPENYRTRHALVLAEVARIEGRNFDAMHLYEEAIQWARRNDFFQNEAIAHEVAARFYSTNGFETIAQTYIKNARYCYLRWGALGKVRQIDQHYALLSEERIPSSAPTIETPFEQLDLGTVIKVSQMVSGEILLEQLVQKLMVVAVEHAGAERGLLILSNGEEHRIASEARTGRDNVEVQLLQASVTPTDLPDSLLRYVIRTQESVILDDASEPNLFSEDDYVRRQQPRSILCLPLVKQTKLKGVLYLENNLARRMFTTKRLAMLELVASQAAISLDHARLYADLIQENDDRRKAEEALRVSEERWSTLAENSSAGIALIAQGGRFIAANQALQKMLGYTEDELKRRTVSDITYGEERVHTEARLAEAYEGLRRVHRIEKRYLRKDGGVVWADVSTVFVPASGNTSAFFSVVIVDITESKRAEEELHRKELELAHVSRVTTMGELAASIAHEVNQPLTAVVTNASACVRWLAAHNLEEAHRSASQVIADGHRAGEIVGRIRALAKKAPAQKDWLDINETIGEVVIILQNEARRNRVSLQTQLANELPLILGDRIQLQQVILNLMVNAIEAISGMKDGPRELGVSSQKVTTVFDESVEKQRSDKAFPEAKSACVPSVLIAVRDSGPGLDPLDLNRLFDAFYTTKPKGLGMGLAISRSIIEAHGGRLWAIATAPRGAVFQFTLPTRSEGCHDEN
jgi:PAS domain S-box-containing protein